MHVRSVTHHSRRRATLMTASGSTEGAGGSSNMVTHSLTTQKRSINLVFYRTKVVGEEGEALGEGEISQDASQ